MANSFSTQALVDKAVAFAFKETAGVASKIDWRSDEFSAVNNTGATVTLRRPGQFLVDASSIGADANLPSVTQPAAGYRNYQEPVVPLTITDRFEVNMQYSLEELTFKLSKDQAYERAIRPAMVALQDKINASLISKIGAAGGMVLSGATAGATTGAEWITNFHKANALLAKRGLTSNDGRKSIVLQPDAIPSIASYGSTLFQAPGAGETMANGQIGKYAGFDLFSSSLIPAITSTSASGSVGTVTACSIATTGTPVWTQTFTVTIGTLSTALPAGTLVSFAGVNWVHPSTKADTGTLATFKVQSDVAAGSNAVVTLSECGIGLGDYQNVTASINGKVMSIAVSGVNKPSYAFFNDAVVGASPKIIVPEGVKGRNISLNGVNIALVEDHWPGTLQSITKLVAFVGLSVVRPESIITLY